MFAIVYKSDGVPICVQVPGVSPDPVVVWSSESAAKAFIEALPSNLRVGIVAFGGTALLVQAPTTNRDELLAALQARFDANQARQIGRAHV